MTSLFGRSCRVLVGPPPKTDVYTLQTVDMLAVEGLRVAFKVTKDDTPTPNNIEVQVYNLSATSRARFEERGARVIILAGYDGDVAQLASGDIRHGQSLKQGVDWVTKVEAGDGERALKHARVSGSWRPGTAVADVITSTAGKLGLDSNGVAGKLGKAVGSFLSGYVQHGRASDELSKLLTPFGMSYSVQDGRVEVLSPDDAVSELGPLISPDTGLVGTPEMGTPAKKGAKQVLKVKMLLQPRLRPGQRFVLQSSTLNGTFKAAKVTHTGDTFGNEWYTEVEATP